MADMIETVAHTPGPWCVKEGGDGDLFVETPDSTVGPIGTYGARNLGQANARLIAAAPELLETCRDVFKVLHSVDLANNADVWRREKNILRAAITKADGLDRGRGL